MIQLYNQIPEVYYKHSRDFQFIGRLFDLILNAVKTNADMIYQLPNGVLIDPRSTEVLARTLGFNTRHDYNQEQLAALVSIFPTLLKYKGTETALKIAGDALVRAAGVVGDFVYTINYSQATIEVVLPYELTDISLFLDLLPYIIPAGMSCTIRRGVGITKVIKTEIITTHDVSAILTNNDQLAQIAPLNETTLEYQFKSDFIDDKNKTVNSGLIGNTLIPYFPFDPKQQGATPTEDN